MGRESLRLSWGVVMNNMMKWMQGNEGTFVVSSCHDNSLLAVLCSIYGQRWREMDLDWPYYANYITFEVWADGDSGERNVKILYNGKEFYALSLKELHNKWKDVMIDQQTYFDKECPLG